MDTHKTFPSTLSSPVVLDDTEFNLRLSALGPFERRPHLAVAVSGGSDSLCLVLLASRWADRRGGKVIALSVDHGLRSNARNEVEQVTEWLRPKGIEHLILSWHGKKPITGIQAAARVARYDLMTRWCRNSHILHLLVAHTLDDQAETFLLRLRKGSGAEGLSAMAEVRETSCVRLLRPLLGIRKTVLQAVLKSEGQKWIEDPSNRDTAFARVRLRKAMLDEYFDVDSLAKSTIRFGRARLALETSVCKLLARSALIHPAGFAVLSPESFLASSEEIGLSALGRVISAIGGKFFPPRMEKLKRLYKGLMNFAMSDMEFLARTLGGCRVLVGNGKYREKILICREVRGLPKPFLVESSKILLWDRRFKIQFSPAIHSESLLGALGEQGWLQVLSDSPELKNCGIPGPVRFTLPTLFGKNGINSVPHLGFSKLNETPEIKNIEFYPPNSISRVGFFLR